MFWKKLLLLSLLLFLNLNTAAIAALSFPTQLTVQAQPDTTPPTLEALDFNPKAINTTLGPDTVTVDFTVSDDISGATQISVVFKSPSTQVQAGSSFFNPALNRSGSFPITFPQFGVGGTWVVDNVLIIDNVNNRLNLGTAEVAALGFPTQLTVQAQPDTTPPTLVALDFNPKTINTASGSDTVTVDFTVSDDISGAIQISVIFKSPSTQVAGKPHVFAPSLNHTGSYTITFPQFGVGGIWVVDNVLVIDNVNNRLNLGTAEVAALGFPIQLIVGPPITVTITPVNPPVQIPATGGAFQFTISITNNSASPQTFDVWNMVTPPSGEPFGPTLGPFNPTMAPGEIISKVVTQEVPGRPAAGAYTYTFNVGTFPGTIDDSDSFPFTKLGELSALQKSSSGETNKWAVIGADGWESLIVEDKNEVLPDGILLEQNYPNPFKAIFFTFGSLQIQPPRNLNQHFRKQTSSP